MTGTNSQSSNQTQDSERLSFAELCRYQRLERTWRALRDDLRHEWGRDCIDFLDIDMGRERWIQRIRNRLLTGTYRPKSPSRREEAKASGHSRVLTVPAIDDLLVYRHICDYVHRLARERQPPGTYFSRRHQREPVGKRIDNLSDSDYLSFFEIWLRYHNYRKYIGLSGLFKYMVLADISNFFDSIQHPLLMEYLGPLGLPREALGVLGQLLQALRPETGHSPSPAVGIPVDSYDCSRMLANFFLFEHDNRLTAQVPSESYARFMDDQAIGVPSETRARQVIRLIQDSLSQQRLALNAAKTRVFNQAQLVEHFWLDENDAIDAIELLLGGPPAGPQVSAAFNPVWGVLTTKDRQGQWIKVAKRLYRAAAVAGIDTITLENCKRDLVDGPLLAEHIFRYLLTRNRYTDYIELFEWLLGSGDSIYEDVEEKWFESLLFVCPPDPMRSSLSALAEEFCRGAARGTGRAGPRVPAALLLYWLGQLNAPIVLESILRGDPMADGNRQRTVAAILCALQPAQLDQWLSLAAREPASQVSHLIEWLARLKTGERFVIPNPLITRRRPLSVGRAIYDARALLRIELLTASTRPDIRKAIQSDLAKARARALTTCEHLILERVENRLATQGGSA